VSSPTFNPQARLRDIEAQLSRIERGISITSACALTLTLLVYVTLPRIHL
jgi:hypothetical protein